MKTKYTFGVFWKEKSKFGYETDHCFRTTADAVKKHLHVLLSKNKCYGIGCRLL